MTLLIDIRIITDFGCHCSIVADKVALDDYASSPLENFIFLPHGGN
jgi:hypothetical protein